MHDASRMMQWNVRVADSGLSAEGMKIQLNFIDLFIK